MSNIYNHNRTPFQFKLDRSECWDFFLSIDEMYGYGDYGAELVERCLSSYIDFQDKGCIDEDTFKSDFVWENAYNKGFTLENIGYTGMDNGFIHYDKTRISNADFIELFTESNYTFRENDLGFILNKVYGNNDIFYYGNTIMPVDSTCAAKLSGGFFQGFYKSGCEYQVLPNNIGHGISLEFTIKKTDDVVETNEYTLNDRYPENKGIFFYWGTRAENKWWTKYDTDEAFAEIFNNYFSDDYFADSYINTCAQTNYFIESDPVEYFTDDYFSDGYATDKCKDKCVCDKEEKQSGKLPYLISYPEMLNTYQRNSKWIYPDGGVWIENEDWTNLHSDTKKCKCKKKCKCDGGYFGDGYGSNLPDVCDCNIYSRDDYHKPDVVIDPTTELDTKDGHGLGQPNIVEITTDNKFIIFDRTCDGYTVDTWHEGDKMVLTDIKMSTKENYFLLFDRTCNGLTVDTANFNNKSYNVKNDLYRNAFALQVKDDGSIGYKYLVQDCDSEEKDYKIESEFSAEDVIPDNEWVTIHIKIEPVGKIYKITDTVTSSNQKMRMYFYVNGKLVFITKELPTFNFRELNDTPDKQEGVPFNISLGGGTQGLSDVVYYENLCSTPNYVLPLEKEFAGTLFGYVKSFKFYDCPLSFVEITKNYIFERVFDQENNYLL